MKDGTESCFYICPCGLFSYCANKRLTLARVAHEKRERKMGNGLDSQKID